MVQFKSDLELTLLRARVTSQTSATAQMVPRDVKGVITGLTCVAGVDLAHYEIRDGGSAGTIIHEIIAPLTESEFIGFPVGLAFDDGVHATLISGTTPDLFVTSNDE